MAATDSQLRLSQCIRLCDATFWESINVELKRIAERNKVAQGSHWFHLRPLAVLFGFEIFDHGLGICTTDSASMPWLRGHFHRCHGNNLPVKRRPGSIGPGAAGRAAGKWRGSNWGRPRSTVASYRRPRARNRRVKSAQKMHLHRLHFRSHRRKTRRNVYMLSAIPNP